MSIFRTLFCIVLLLAVALNVIAYDARLEGAVVDYIDRLTDGVLEEAAATRSESEQWVHDNDAGRLSAEEVTAIRQRHTAERLAVYAVVVLVLTVLTLGIARVVWKDARKRGLVGRSTDVTDEDIDQFLAEANSRPRASWNNEDARFG
jgi:hypothetical protein